MRLSLNFGIDFHFVMPVTQPIKLEAMSIV